MPQWRRDRVTGGWVIVTPERARRPHDFQCPRDAGGKPLPASPPDPPPAAVVSSCPFCPGNEQMTPPEIFALRPPGGQANGPGWSIRVVPNKFSALTPEETAAMDAKDAGMEAPLPGYGYHEVLIEGPDHGRRLEDWPPEHLAVVLQVAVQRLNALLDENGIQYVQLFKNDGNGAGASLAHPHWQLVALPMVPPAVDQELRGARRFAEETGECVFCHLLRRERRGVRQVAENQDFVAFVPYAARFPYETWILPRRHSADVAELVPGPGAGPADAGTPVPGGGDGPGPGLSPLLELARLLQQVVGRMNRVLGHPPYNIMVHTAPRPAATHAFHYHWHLEIVPRLGVAAGFEMGTGLFINVFSPEAAARDLRGKG
ncbi:MAG: galactose-1-phosphate uridylyltransferase [Firmicutes bacterium]|nr:galactose-1-phosphate uridylyltransferase [Bacillota bacterium]